MEEIVQNFNEKYLYLKQREKLIEEFSHKIHHLQSVLYSIKVRLLFINISCYTFFFFSLASTSLLKPCRKFLGVFLVYWLSGEYEEPNEKKNKPFGFLWLYFYSKFSYWGPQLANWSYCLCFWVSLFCYLLLLKNLLYSFSVHLILMNLPLVVL